MQYFERLKSLLGKKNMSVSVFSQKTEIHEKTLYNYISGKTEPSITQIEKIVKAIPDINCYWLLTGRGDMLLSDTELQEPLIHFGNVNHGIAGQMDNTYQTITDCEKAVAALKTENTLLRESVRDKELIISLLTQQSL